MTLGYTVHALSDTGRCREINEDSVGYRPLAGGGVLAVVADGVGGKPGGALASRLAVDTLLTELARAPGDGDAPGNNEQRLRLAASQANSVVREARRQHAGYEEMATTLLALLARGREAALLHAGDSRAYRWRGGTLTGLTRDDTVAEQMLADGTLAPSDMAATPYQHMLTRAVGISAGFPHTLCRIALEPGDVVLLCSDGLSKVVEESAIATILAAAPEPAAATALVAAANAAGGPDNVSIILITCTEAER